MMTVMQRVGSGVTPLALASVVLGAAVVAAPSPLASAGPPVTLVAKVGNCSGAVLNTRSGRWLIASRHCGRPTRVTVAGGSYAVTRWVPMPGPLVPHDVSLVQVSRRITGAAGGGFALGRAPRSGSRVTVRGIVGAAPAGCPGLRVRYYRGYPEVSGCYLPNGTSGGPWYTPDWVLHGVTGGIDAGGRSNDITNTVPFDQTVLDWAFRTIS